MGKLCLSGLALFGALCCSAAPAVAGNLFTQATAADAAAPKPWVLRADNVAIVLSELAGKKAGDELSLNLFPDADYAAAIRKVEAKGKDRIIISGVLADQEGSEFILARNRNVVFGTIKTADGREFSLRHTAGGHQIQEINADGFPACGTDHGQDVQVAEALPDFGSVADDGTVFDVMVAYTPDARAAVGGTAAMESLIDLAIVETNNAYAQSGINSQVNLVHTHEVSSSTSGDFSTDLNRLTDKTDGYWDEVHGLRDQYGADFVSLLVDNNQYCGMAWLMTSLSPGFEQYAFSVVAHSCATGYYSFAHEIGHNQGSAHDRANAGSGLYSYSYGWRFYGDNNVQYRTVMAYSPGSRIARFSNPNVAYMGTATGTSTDNNALSINNAAMTVANFRSSATITPLATYSKSTGALWIGNAQIIGGANLEGEFQRSGRTFSLVSSGPATTTEVGATYYPATGELSIPEGTVIEDGDRFFLELSKGSGSTFNVVDYGLLP